MTKEVVGDPATAYAQANFVASKPVGSGNLAGYGFHNTGINGAFLFLDESDGYLHLLKNNNLNETILFKSDIPLESGSISGDNTITWIKWGRIVVISILNLVPYGYIQLTPGPIPLVKTYNAVVSVDGDAAIFSIDGDGYVYLEAGDAAKQYTGTIIYVSV